MPLLQAKAKGLKLVRRLAEYLTPLHAGDGDTEEEEVEEEEDPPFCRMVSQLAEEAASAVARRLLEPITSQLYEITLTHPAAGWHKQAAGGDRPRARGAEGRGWELCTLKLYRLFMPWTVARVDHHQSCGAHGVHAAFGTHTCGVCFAMLCTLHLPHRESRCPGASWELVPP